MTDVDSRDDSSRHVEATETARPVLVDSPPVAHQHTPVVESRMTFEPESTASPSAPVLSTTDAAVTPKARVLLLFSGPSTVPHNLQHLIRDAGMAVESFDILHGSAGDLSDDTVWDPLFQSILKGRFDGMLASPPCSTFCRLRGAPNGPPALRGVAGPDRYGFRTLDPKHQEHVRLHNLLAIRTAKAFKAMVDLCRPAVVEQPAWRQGETSMFALDEFIELNKLPGTELTTAPQSTFGAPAAKETTWLVFGMSFSDMAKQCTHQKRTWYRQGDATPLLSKHHPSRGVHRFHLTVQQALDDKTINNEFVLKKLAHYPELLGKIIALKFAKALRSASKPPEVPVMPQHMIPQEKLEFRENLRGLVPEEQKLKQEAMAIGGLRNACKSLTKLKVVSEFGASLGRELLQALKVPLINRVPIFIKQRPYGWGVAHAIHRRGFF